MNVIGLLAGCMLANIEIHKFKCVRYLYYAIKYTLILKLKKKWNKMFLLFQRNTNIARNPRNVLIKH